MFTKNIDTTDRQGMINFLTRHPRYYTMNSWNRSTSYANNVKLYNLDIPDEYKDKAYDLLSTDIFDEFTPLFHEFTAAYGYAVGFNGRSSGYIVLYDTNYNHETDTLAVCPGKNIDQYEDFNDWDLDELKDRVALVTAFDKLCDACRDIFIKACEECEIEEITIYEPKTIKRLKLPE